VKDSVKRAQSIVGQSEGRPEDDFYPTPSGATLGLLEVERFTGPIWEPACGQGHITEVLLKNGFQVWSSDKIDYGYGDETKDFFSYYRRMSPTIITNPPFKRAVDFAKKALELRVDKIALLLKLAFLEGVERSYWLEESGLRRVFVFRNRLTMARNGEPLQSGGMIAFAWYIWELGYTGQPEVGWCREVPVEVSANSIFKEMKNEVQTT
jgi:hypothetical protein